MCEEVAPKQPWHHAELFKKEDLMPDVDASLCEGKGAEETLIKKKQWFERGGV